MRLILAYGLMLLLALAAMGTAAYYLLVARNRHRTAYRKRRAREDEADRQADLARTYVDSPASRPANGTETS